MNRIGERIKKKRELLHIQLNDLAKKVGISSSALSQIEKSKAFPSIFTLKSIAESLNTTVGELIGENETLNNNPVVSKEEIKFVEKSISGAEIFLLSHHDVNKHMDTYLIRFPKDSDSEGIFPNHKGQNFCYVISGQLELDLDDKNYQLEQGDNIYFYSRTRHKLTNTSTEVAEIMWIVSPPAF